MNRTKNWKNSIALKSNHSVRVSMNYKRSFGRKRKNGITQNSLRSKHM